MVCYKCNYIIKPIFITTNSHRCVMHILTPLFKHMSNYKNTYAFRSKTVQAILCAVHTAFSQHNISRGLWPCLPNQNLQFEFYLRGMVSDQEYNNNLPTEDKMNESIHIAVPTISLIELRPLHMFLSLTLVFQPKETIPSIFFKYGKLHLKCGGTNTETRFRLSAKRTSPYKSAGH